LCCLVQTRGIAHFGSRSRFWWRATRVRIRRVRVLTDEEARDAILKLGLSGDEEGAIPYDQEAEFVIECHAAHGMSGGGVFDSAYRQVGIAVRASFNDPALQYVRAVRMSFVVARMNAALASLSIDERAKVVPYLETGFGSQR
jgi:hypothetical protein